uniref:Uncharacterized protein n=1 Tax=Rhizophora mucronata TaxID=61149 RepID=A0A2P2JBL7_RHIMU
MGKQKQTAYAWKSYVNQRGLCPQAGFSLSFPTSFKHHAETESLQQNQPNGALKGKAKETSCFLDFFKFATVTKCTNTDKSTVTPTRQHESYPKILFSHLQKHKVA